MGRDPDRVTRRLLIRIVLLIVLLVAVAVFIAMLKGGHYILTAFEPADGRT